MKLCSIDGCGKVHCAKGLCNKHWQRMHYYGRTTLLRNHERHGLKTHYLYVTWENMKSRCNNPNDRDYKHYGGRGIIVYPDWNEHFPIFLEYILENLGDRPSGMSIDRINVDLGYIPGNIRWATSQQQVINRKYPLPSTGVRGVLPSGEKYRSTIRIEGKKTHLGVFDTVEEASEAYERARLLRDKQVFGE